MAKGQGSSVFNAICSAQEECEAAHLTPLRCLVPPEDRQSSCPPGTAIMAVPRVVRILPPPRSRACIPPNLAPSLLVQRGDPLLLLSLVRRGMHRCLLLLMKWGRKGSLSVATVTAATSIHSTTEAIDITVFAAAPT